MAFGGGGPMHAVALARDLKVPRVIVPVNSAVFSAWGMLLTDLRRDYVHTYLMALNATMADAVATQFRGMEAEAAANMEREGFQADGGTREFEYLLDMRYQGQEHTVKIPVSLTGASLDVRAVAEVFHATHEKRYTYRLPNPLQIVNFHLVARALVPKPGLPKATITGRRIGDAVIGSRQVDFDTDGTLEAVTYNGSLLEPGMKLQGPAVIQEPAVTLVVPPGEQVSVDEYGNYHVELGRLA
jgi:N-methylhydantoinase A